MSLTIKPFHGDAKTTTKDVITYYTSACLAKAELFISNAEVLGINVVDQVGLGPVNEASAHCSLALTVLNQFVLDCKYYRHLVPSPVSGSRWRCSCDYWR